jgi:hypothetical protein
LYNDAKEFDESVLGIVQEQSAADPGQVYRVERRTKAVGRVYVVTKMIDKLHRDAWKLARAQYEERVLQLRYRIHSLLDDLEDRANPSWGTGLLKKKLCS